MKMLKSLRLACFVEIILCLCILAAWLVWSRTPYWKNGEGGPNKVCILVAIGALALWTIGLLYHLVIRRAARSFWFVATVVACVFALMEFLGFCGELRGLNFYMENVLWLGESWSENLGVALLISWTGACVASVVVASWPLFTKWETATSKALP
jgi:hypothetical protein